MTAQFPVLTVAMKMMLLKMMVVEFVVGHGLRGGADDATGLHSLQMVSGIAKRGQGASAGGGR